MIPSQIPAHFDALQGLRLIEEVVRRTALPASRQEICDHGLILTARGLGASGGVILLGEPEGLVQAVSWGTYQDAEGLRRLGQLALTSDEAFLVEQCPDNGPPMRLALPIPGGSEAAGVIVVETPLNWDPQARLFASSAAQAIGSALQASRRLAASNLNGILLVQRNVELEALRELAVSLQDQVTEEEALQIALDLLLRKLGLESGWIFWGESSVGQLNLAAHRGIADEFVQRSRASGIGQCLCLDVFATGRLRFARNTTDCPRLPELVCGHEPMTHACIPLKFERGVMGVMNIANRPGRLFTPSELQFLEIAGNQLCLAVNKVRTAQAEHRSNAEARALASLARAIGGSLQEERVLEAVGEYARQLLSVDRCAIFLGNEPANLHFAYLSGPPLEGLEVGKPADVVALGSRGIVQALSEKRTLVVGNTTEDPRVNAELARRWDMGSCVLVPLLAHDRPEGLLVAGRSAPSSWKQEDVALADALAGHAALAIENARLYREAREALAQLQQAQYGMMRAERLAAVGTLAASLAHEVRNPLNSINLQLVLLSRRVLRLDGPMCEELTGMVRTAQQEISRLDGLVEEFLSLSSIDRLSRTEADLEEIVRDVLLLMDPVARQQSVFLVESFSGSLPRLLIDREKIKQVLINLIRNAIEAMPGGGRLTLSTRMVGDAVLVDVADMGTGIGEGIDVFDFFMTTKRGGTGLGLPIARRIVEAHGGSLTYESKPGTGTVFTVSFKADREG